MGICAEELRTLVIRPTLTQLAEGGRSNRAAENLLLGTAAQESGLGFHLKVSRAQGLGIYRITPKTHTAIWDRYLIDYPDLASNIRGIASQHEFLAHPHAELATNLKYATAIAWAIYRRSGKALPTDATDIAALGKFWARHFGHRPLHAVAEFCGNYQKFIDPNSKRMAAA